MNAINSQDLQKIRLKNKQVLLDHALKVFGCMTMQQHEKEHWIEYLLAGGEFQSLLNFLKNKQPLPEIAVPLPRILQEGAGFICIDQPPPSFQAGEIQAVRVNIENRSHTIWHTDKSSPIHLSYHWYAENGDEHHFDGLRTVLSEPIEPGAVAVMPVNVKTPDTSGNFLLEITMVKEGHFWFEQCGLHTCREPVRVDPPKLARHAQQIYQDLLSAIALQRLEMV